MNMAILVAIFHIFHIFHGLSQKSHDTVAAMAAMAMGVSVPCGGARLIADFADLLTLFADDAAHQGHGNVHPLLEIPLVIP